jgi:hypothetical protein
LSDKHIAGDREMITMKNKIVFVFSSLLLLNIGLSPVIAGECASPKPEWIFCDDFESGNFDKWNLVWTTSDIQLVPPPQDSQTLVTPPNRGGNSVARFHYVIPGSGPEHQDSNRQLELYTTPIHHGFVRGYVLIPKNTRLHGASSFPIQRKLIYFKLQDWDTSGLAFFLTSEPPSDDLSANYIKLRLGYGGGSANEFSIWNMGRMPVGKWVAIQVEFKLNTPGQSDGIFRLWIDNALTYETTSINLRKNNTNGINKLQFGDQADRINNDPVDEYRYWDDIVISTTQIPVLYPPQNLR